MGTGHEQNITITANTNLSDEEIDKAVKEAEQFAADDKKRKEAVDIRNNADSLVYQSEKSLTELGDKLDAADKTAIEGLINDVKEKLKGEDTDAIKAATEELSKKFYEVSSKIYQQAQAEQASQGAPNAEPAANDNVVDSDFEEVE